MAELTFTGRFITDTVKLLVLLRRTKIVWFHCKVPIMQIVAFISIVLSHAWFYHVTVMRNQSLFDCIYFVYTTLSTIGFGHILFDVDYLISLDLSYQIFLYTVGPLFFFVGFSLLASLINSFVTLRTDGKIDDKLAEEEDHTVQVEPSEHEVME